MDTKQKLFWSGVVVLSVMGALAWFGATPFLKTTSNTVVQQLAGSAAGSTFNTAKFAGITFGLATPGANGTSSSVTNTDASDRYVTGYRVGCQNVGTSLTAYTGTGLAALTYSIGTSTTAAPASINPFAAITLNRTLGTTTSAIVVASSTTQVATSSYAAIWHSGEIMTITFNATNTASGCTFGLDYMGS